MTASQLKFRQPDQFGHVYDGKVQDGYAVCSACDSVENTSEAASPCTGTFLGNKLTKTIQLEVALLNLYMLVKYETDLPEGAANGVESQGLDEGVVRAGDILEEVRKLVEDPPGRFLITREMRKHMDCPFPPWEE